MTIRPPYGGRTGSLPAVLTSRLALCLTLYCPSVCGTFYRDFSHTSRIGVDLIKAIRESVRDEHTTSAYRYYLRKRVSLLSYFSSEPYQ